MNHAIVYSKYKLNYSFSANTIQYSISVYMIVNVIIMMIDEDWGNEINPA